MDRKELLHVTKFPWVFVEGKKLTVTLRTGKDVRRAEVWYCDPCDFVCNEEKASALQSEDGHCDPGHLTCNEEKIPALRCSEMEEAFQDTEYAYFRTEVFMESHKLRYQFRIFGEGAEESCWFSENGATDTAEEERIRPFLIPYTYEHEQCSRPDWAAQMNWYQIFPDRFSRGVEKNSGKCADEVAGKQMREGMSSETDGAADKDAELFVPERENFYGGTLKGVQEKLPYLKSLGINGIYLNPVFSSHSNHRYDTKDYLTVDPMLGMKEDLKELAEACHANGMRIMLDGVYNHCGYDAPIWQDVLINGRKSRYFHWFCIYDEAALQQEDCRMLSSDRMKQNPPYEAFAFAANMPKWNTANPEVQDYLIGAAEYWTRYLDVDAWRLDVPDEVDKGFLREFYRRIKEINPEAYIIGEIWQDADRWFEERIFDGVMDYPFYFAVRDFFLLGNISAYEFCDRITRHSLLLPEKVQQNNFHFLSNHDLPRALTVAGGDKRALVNAYRFLTLFGGSLSVYYGDEAGLAGGNDPDCRRVYPWNSVDEELLEEFRRMLVGRNGEWMTGRTRKWVEPVDDRQIRVWLESDCKEQTVVFQQFV